MEVNSEAYFETDHYKGWPAVLIRMQKVTDTELKHRLQIAWRMLAPKKLLTAKATGGALSSKKSSGSAKSQRKR
jgi:hypothetical protein